MPGLNTIKIKNSSQKHKIMFVSLESLITRLSYQFFVMKESNQIWCANFFCFFLCICMYLWHVCSMYDIWIYAIIAGAFTLRRFVQCIRLTRFVVRLGSTATRYRQTQGFSNNYIQLPWQPAVHSYTRTTHCCYCLTLVFIH